jgi:hypothetical protein
MSARTTAQRRDRRELHTTIDPVLDEELRIAAVRQRVRLADIVEAALRAYLEVPDPVTESP